MREIVLDTETTGLEPRQGDRVVEIGAVEVLNGIPTAAQSFHVYIDPERAMPDEAFRVHGLSDEFLKGKPKFAEIAGDFLKFLGDSRLVAHNASFDVAFLNAELERCGLTPIAPHQVVDTLAIARRKHVGASNSLDALCARYGIDNSRREKHGALLDAELLAEVYVELTGGRQATLVLAAEADVAMASGASARARPRPYPLQRALTEAERAAHAAFIATFDAPLWEEVGLPALPSPAVPSERVAPSTPCAPARALGTDRPAARDALVGEATPIADVAPTGAAARGPDAGPAGAGAALLEAAE